ncbi:MAG: hypothetical protein JW981_03745, partial [Anaerolineae bacterium]|nr:hypothetical protein [Anaerolineae bacterium]
AFLHGLEDVLDDPERAFEISKQYIEGLENNTATQRAVLDTSIEYWQAPELGKFNPQSWEQAQEVMASMGLIEEKVSVDTLFTNQFVIP